MKLKYYMRGLGIGILITTLILTIGKEKLSEEEIIEKAEALGMVMQEDDSDLDKLLDHTDLSGTPSPSMALTEPTAGPTAEPTAEPTPAPIIEPAKTPTIPAAPTMADIQPTKAADSTEGTITFTIKKGMSSGQVAKLLVEKGLIEDADDFNQYIVKKGKASIIRVGEYTVSADASYDEIVTAITTKNK